jgi:hypothetical protein
MKTLGLAVGVVLLCTVGAVAQFHYAFYYDLTGRQDLEINLSNPMFSSTQFVMTVHDAYGAEIWTLEGVLESAESGYVRLGERVPDVDYPWGVVTVDSTERLIVGLEYSKDGQLVSVDTVHTEAPLLDSTSPFWLGTYYSLAGGSETTFIVMNPWPMTTECVVTAYDRNAVTVYERTFVLGPYESEAVSLGAVLGYGTNLWGLLDVRMQERAVVLALEYSGRGCSGLEIDNVTDFYY